MKNSEFRNQKALIPTQLAQCGPLLFWQLLSVIGQQTRGWIERIERILPRQLRAQAFYTTNCKAVPSLAAEQVQCSMERSFDFVNRTVYLQYWHASSTSEQDNKHKSPTKFIFLEEWPCTTSELPPAKISLVRCSECR